MLDVAAGAEEAGGHKLTSLNFGGGECRVVRTAGSPDDALRGQVLPD